MQVIRTLEEEILPDFFKAYSTKGKTTRRGVRIPTSLITAPLFQTRSMTMNTGGQISGTRLNMARSMILRGRSLRK